MFLLAVRVQRAVGFPFLDFLQARDRAFDGIEIRQGAAEPALGHIILVAVLGGFLDRLLGLFFSADKQHLAAFAHRFGQKIAGRLQLSERLAQINDVNAVACVKDERFHLRVPAPRLVSKMDA